MFGSSRGEYILATVGYQSYRGEFLEPIQYLHLLHRFSIYLYLELFPLGHRQETSLLRTSHNLKERLSLNPSFKQERVYEQYRNKHPTENDDEVSNHELPCLCAYDPHPKILDFELSGAVPSRDSCGVI